MKILGFYVTREDYESLYHKKCKEAETLDKCASRNKRESTEAHLAYNTLQKQYADLSVQLQEAKDTIFVREEDIKELRSRLEEAKSSNVELSERLEKEMSDNCELQNLYADKCKECETLDDKLALVNGQLDRLTQENAALEEKLSQFGDEKGYVVVTEEYLNQLKADSEKFRSDREKHNANRRKSRAAKKVAHAKAETAQK